MNALFQRGKEVSHFFIAINRRAMSELGLVWSDSITDEYKLQVARNRCAYEALTLMASGRTKLDERQLRRCVSANSTTLTHPSRAPYTFCGTPGVFDSKNSTLSHQL